MPINEPLFVPLFLTLFAMVLAWFGLARLLLRRLEASHPAKFEAMGSPSLFLRDGPSGTSAMLGFLLTREHTSLGDGYLSTLSDAMLVFLLVYSVLFLGLFFSIAGQFATAT